MPTPTQSPPPIPATAVAPTPAAEYRLSEHAPADATKPNADLTAALNRRAGIRDAAPPASDPRTLPSQPPRAPLDAPADAKPLDPKPAPHVKFIAADDREPPAPSDKPAEAPAKVPGEPPPEVVKSAPAQLREAYERLKSEFSTKAAEEGVTRKQLSEYQAKAKAYEDRIKTLESAETRAKDLEKQVLAYDEQLRVTNYLQHPEFHERYVKPVAEGMQEGHALVKELLTTDAEGNARYGTESDFAEILAQPNHALMDKKAVELFGERMSIHVVEQAKKVRSAQQAQARAMKDANVASMDFLKRQQAAAAQQRTEARSAFERVASEMGTKFASLYRPAENDAEAATAHQAGRELADLVVVNGRPEDMPAETYLAAAAKAYHRLASWPMHQLALQRLQAELDATRTRLSAYEKSTPDTSSRQQPGGVQVDAGGAVIPGGKEDLRAQMRASLERRAGVRK